MEVEVAMVIMKGDIIELYIFVQIDNINTKLNPDCMVHII